MWQLTHHVLVTGSYALHEYGDVRPSDTFSCDGSETKLLNCLRVELGNINCVAGMPRASVMCTGKSGDDLLMIVHWRMKQCIVCGE